MKNFASIFSSIVARKGEVKSLNDIGSRVLAEHPDMDAPALAHLLKTALDQKELTASFDAPKTPAMLMPVAAAPSDPVSDAIQIAQALVATKKYTVDQVAQALVSPEVYPNLTALQLGTVLLAHGVYPGLPRDKMQQALQSCKKYSPEAIADALRVLYPAPPPPVAQLVHRWVFAEPGGNAAVDMAGNLNGTLSNAGRVTQGPAGSTAVHLNGSDDSRVNFGTGTGQFGAGNFSVALWFKTTETYRYFDIIGNRTAGSHGIFFCLRMTGRHEFEPAGMITTEVDENGRNYIALQSRRSGLNDGQWHHVVVVRDGASLKLYIDGALSASANGPGVANIANGNPFILGRSLVGVEAKFAPNAQYADVRVYSGAVTESQIAQMYAPAAMLIHRWTFAEPGGPVAKDVVGNVDGTLSPSAARVQQGPPGHPAAVHIDGSDGSFVTFGTGAGQFGQNNFSAALWLNTRETLRYFDVVGNRTAPSHGTFFCIRMTGRHESEPHGIVTTEVDASKVDSIGVAYIGLNSGRFTGLNNGQWHHVVVVRNGASLTIYIDGQRAGSANGSGVANIVNNNPFKLGRSVVGIAGRFAPDAQYADLRIYNSVLTDDQVRLLYNNQF